MLLTIGELIEELKRYSEKFGSNAPIAIDDADTNWHMKISEISESSEVRGRILIGSAGYSKDSCLES